MRLFVVSCVLVLLLAIIGLGGAYVAMRHLNVFQEYETAYAGSCIPVVGVPGVEDMAADVSLKRAWLSSMDRRDISGQVRGAIIAFDPENPLDTASWRDRTGGVPAVFEPLGIDLYKDEEVHRLFVVNAARPSVLIYDVGPDGRLDLAQTLTDTRLTSPNSVVAVGPSEFYVTNSSQGAGRGLLSDLGFLIGTASGSVLYFDGSSWSNAADELKRANGIEISADGAKLYVAETSAKSVAIFDRDIRSGVIVPAGALSLEGFPDNINRLEDGTLLVGTIPKPWSFSKHTSSADALSPSRIVKIEMPYEAEGMPEALFQDDGEGLSGATSAVRLGQKLLIGAYAENKFLLCN
ncbi:strictosidine synthase family protein [Parvularcula sp. IMCC14364]|uniref:strictosidine synthase family protein n=1 Tax=Parvularcula sp. IMCC14364 TaxID=3067902 RepID=UPI002742926C|nr:SMP-30/gluconolactonase/LRE family protein [Parvularcula sp. IMCC14364]